ncbi:uncharacterized protein E0L32_010746 [Thyridium curvatum]|uniref:DUF676 domain-containing protein n=1 Tax=Thyridium curvatum TaxID=1093900 RepID=A0A507AM89_9PEZI|nr:uncharacterized protein E0L32_010746 [Thyridium curvatum]TPX07324.1 hypothetical protein E0L32_010746 [Thyridium curvatum]
MLLLHQIGSVKVGEVVRYTVTYTPSHDRILPSPEVLHLRIRNTSAIALRAAFVHGPYTLSVAAYPSHFDPNRKFPDPRRYGVPEFEPMLKAGGVWSCRLVVPEDVRQTAGEGTRHGYFGGGPDKEGQSVSWVVEVASQVIFSASAAVNYEVMVARDEKSLSIGASSTGIPVVGGQAQVPQPGKVSDYQKGRDGHHPEQPRGVFSRAVRLKVEDTAALWNKPELPGWQVGPRAKGRGAAAGANVTVVPDAPPRRSSGERDARSGSAPEKLREVHLVLLTHGIHSNLGADMLFLKESIDAGVRQARIDRKARREKERAEAEAAQKNADLGGEKEQATSAESAEPQTRPDMEDDDDEEVIVRGFSGNATRTEKGIKYLGKRMARYVLSMTYPDQPFLPAVKAASESVSNVFHPGNASSSKHGTEGKPSHKHSTIHKAPIEVERRAYKITKISFIAHSLGGLVQTYAVAYIQKHSPQFFDLIKPINFIALASPFLGLNHENPLYVKFALDFGFVGRTGQDLGLTWRAPTIARSGWGAIVNLGENAHKRVLGEAQPESKPLLRILPTGPAHTALKKFRNRTVYSNVVNDGIVPLRTSCLLFLDWQGLERVEKARRETGLVEAVVGFGWAELTGANVSSPRTAPYQPSDQQTGEPSQEEIDSVSTSPTSPTAHGHNDHEVPQPSANTVLEDDRQSLRSVTNPYPERIQGSGPDAQGYSTASTNTPNPLSGIFNFFKSHEPPKPTPPPSEKQNRIYKRSQTLKVMAGDDSTDNNSASSSRSRVTTGHELGDDPEGVSAPPRTTFFESTADLLNPRLPSVEYLIDPSKRPRTIFHDRVYHPSDIPPPPLKKRPTGALSLRRKSFQRTSSSNSVPQAGESQGSTLTHQNSAKSGSSSPYPPSPTMPREDSMASQHDYDDAANTNPDRDPGEVVDSSQMRVEEKIARAYHRGLSWRKVLVKLEPDAHNNLIVRRMFANAFGWPVVKHLVDAHFSDSAAARMRDEDESGRDMAFPMGEAPDRHGAETEAQTEGLRSGGHEGPERSPGGSSGRSHEADGGGGGGGGAKEADVGKNKRVAATNAVGGDAHRELERSVSEAREATDTVPELPRTPLREESGRPLSRPGSDRLDSVSWSDRDWLDTEDESEAEAHDLAYGGGPSPRRKSEDGDDMNKSRPGGGKGGAGLSVATGSLEVGEDSNAKRSSSPLAGAWNWTQEKIIGKGAGASSNRSRSPREPPPAAAG